MSEMSTLQMAAWVMTELVTVPLLPLAGLAVSVLILSTIAAANTTPQERSIQRQREEKGEAVALESKHTIVFLVAATTGLLSMWMFPNLLIYLSLLSFAVGSFLGMVETLPSLLQMLGVSRSKAFKAGVGISGLLCVIWFILRNSRSGWIFQNMLGGFSITMMLMVFKPSTLAMPVLLLSAAFVYDVFFVFGTPYLTSTGESIMEAAATGAAMTVKETIPMLFRMPAAVGEAFLGFGDVVLPGILVVFLRESDARLAQTYQERLDKKQGGSPTVLTLLSGHGSAARTGAGIGVRETTAAFVPFMEPTSRWSLVWSRLTAGWRRQHPSLSVIPSLSMSSVHYPAGAGGAGGVRAWTYYAIAIAWYAVGLQVTFVAMMMSGRGQPALLYLVPCTILPVVYSAYRRGELSLLWHGWKDVAESPAEPEDSQDQAQQHSPLDIPLQ